MHSDEINEALEKIHALVHQESPHVEVKRYDYRGMPSGVDFVKLVTFGYIGNLSRHGDDRRFLVFDDTKNYRQSSDGTWFYTGDMRSASDCPWGCESADLTVEKLEKAYQVVVEAIERAKEAIAACDTPERVA